jgi:hypothetical protein
VRARLHNLFASLGELPGFPDLTAPERDEALAGLLDDICPAGTVAVLGRQLPDRRLALEDLLVSSRGVVLVGPGPSHAVSGSVERGGNGRGRALLPRAAPRSSGVRETLRRAHALRAWLGATLWQGTVVWAAVCSCSGLDRVRDQPVVLDGLWLGPGNLLPAWLASGDALDETDVGALGCFLAAALPLVGDV